MSTMQASTTSTGRRRASALIGSLFCLAFLGAAAIVLTAPSLAASQQAAPAPDEMKILERVRQIGMKLKAPCHPEMMVAQHESPETLLIRKEIRQMLVEGKTEDDILNAMRAKHGDTILAEAPLSGWRVWAIVGGAVAVLGAFLLIGRFMMAHEKAPTALHVVEEVEEEKAGTKVA